MKFKQSLGLKVFMSFCFIVSCIFAGGVKVSYSSPLTIEQRTIIYEQMLIEKKEITKEQKSFDYSSFSIELAKEALRKKIGNDSLRSSVRFSTNPADLEPLKNTEWEFTYTIGYYPFTDNITFDGTIDYVDGEAYLSFVNGFGAEGIIFYDDEYDEFASIAVDYYYYYYYYFTISNSTATGDILFEDVLTGEYTDYFSLTGNKICCDTFDPPIVTTNTCSSITENTATLNGTVNPNGSATTYKFEYGKTTSYGSVTPAGDAGAATTVKSVSAKLTGLTANTLYHFRLVAWNSAGTTNGSDQTFTTTSVPPVPKPTVTTGVASSIATTTITLNGTVNPNGAAATYYFEYGTTATYGKVTTTTSAGSGTTATSVNANLTGLTAKTTYNFRLVATNSAGTTTGNNQTFTTLDNPNPGTGPTLALSSGSGAPGQPVTVNLTLTNVAGTAVSAISTDIAFDSNVLETPSAVIGTAGTSAGKTITKILVGTNVFRVGVLAMDNNNAIGNGVVASVTFKIKSTATNGATTQLTQTATGSNQSAGEIAITGTAGTITMSSCGLGDCNCDGKVSISEVQAAVNMYLGINSVQSCCDRDGNGSISISEVQAVINNYLGIVSAANAISEDQDDYTERTVTRAGTPTLTLEGKTATAGSTVKLALTLANSSGAVASISTDISYDVNLFASVTAAIGPSGTSASKAITQRDLGGGVIRVGVLAMDNNNIISDGVVAYLTLTAKSTATGTASIKNTASGSNQNAQEIVITGNTAQVSFGSTATAPTATNSTTSLITSTTATLNGTVNPKGLATTYKFEYGKTTAYGQLTPAGDAGSGTTSKAVSANLTGLTANTTYNFRLVAWNSAGTTNAVNTTFTTAAATGTVTKPTVTTSAATLITSNSVKLAGTINPNSGVTTYYFEYGATTTYGAKTSSLNAGSGTTAISVKANMLGLTPNTTYHFRLVGTNSAGTTYGADKVFSTALKPLVTTSSATSVTSTSAILNGSVDPNGGVTDYYFEYGTTTSYGSITRDKRSKRVSTSVNESITGLSKNTLYHFRLVATNSAGTTYGLDKTFTTLP